MTLRFDPTRAIVYDLARGQLRDDEGTARLNIPAALLLRLCESAGADAAQDFASSIGSELGRRVADKLGQQTGSASVELWAEHLGGQLALLGFGDLSVEQWGKALVLSVQGSPAGTAELVGNILTAALQRGLGLQSKLVAFSAESCTQYLVAAPATAQKVEQLKSSGSGLGQIIESLHRGAA